MKIAVLGTGVVGQSIGGRLAELGHQVVFGTREPADTLARTQPDQYGRPPFAVWLRERPGIELTTFADAAGPAEIVVNATSGDGAMPALQAAGAPNLAGKVLIDITNPLDFSAGFPPTFFVKDTDSLGEQIQRAFPQARVVKTLNTVTAYVMISPKDLADGDHTVFVSGDDPQAKQVVIDLLRSFGWTDILDLGDLSTCRGTELYLALWTRLLPVTGGNGNFNIKVVR
ncbi:MAG: NADP oxidoreductase [Actinobacteria bacterium 13_2_20CM_2_71_6]|nr:MAG: NADP oxidoreductase [Actinobacteria bacterium 13_2_20CM_2_71_6]